MIERGFGVSALIEPNHIQPLAHAAEQAGFATFWVNDVPDGNGLEQLARAQAVTSGIRLGVGVLPVDRWPASDVVREVERLRLDTSRLALGIGSGALRTGALDATAAACRSLKDAGIPTVLVGALGPTMCELAGREGDGVILNWLVPTVAPTSAAIVHEGARFAGRTDAEVVAYVRTAADSAADEPLMREASNYETYPAYSRHFARMGVRAIDTAINGTSDQITSRFEAFSPAVDEVVARAITRDGSLAAYLAVLSAAAPNGG